MIKVHRPVLSLKKSMRLLPLGVVGLLTLFTASTHAGEDSVQYEVLYGLQTKRALAATSVGPRLVPMDTADHDQQWQRILLPHGQTMFKNRGRSDSCLGARGLSYMEPYLKVVLLPCVQHPDRFWDVDSTAHEIRTNTGNLLEINCLVRDPTAPKYCGREPLVGTPPLDQSSGISAQWGIIQLEPPCPEGQICQ